MEPPPQLALTSSSVPDPSPESDLVAMLIALPDEAQRTTVNDISGGCSIVGSECGSVANSFRIVLLVGSIMPAMNEFLVVSGNAPDTGIGDRTSVMANQTTTKALGIPPVYAVGAVAATATLPSQAQADNPTAKPEMHNDLVLTLVTLITAICIVVGGVALGFRVA